MCDNNTIPHPHLFILTSEDSKHHSLTGDFQHLVSHHHTKQRSQETGGSPVTMEDSVTNTTRWGWPTWQLSICTVRLSGTSTSVSSACQQAFINTQSMCRVLRTEDRHGLMLTWMRQLLETFPRHLGFITNSITALTNTWCTTGNLNLHSFVM